MLFWQSRRKIFFGSLENFSLKVRKKYNFPQKMYFLPNVSGHVECSFNNHAEKFSFKIRKLFAQCQSENVAALLRLLLLISSLTRVG